MESKVKSEVYDYCKRKCLLNSLCEEYQFIKREVIGRSCAGRDITALKIGSGTEYTLITAAFHGSESITAVVLLMFIEELCGAIKTNGFIKGIKARLSIKDRGVIFVPCVNPDGCEISIHGETAFGGMKNLVSRHLMKDLPHWNANLRGVDINHNFNVGWEELHKKEMKMGIHNPAPTRFGGFRPESEPETVALTELCRKVKIRQAIALHSQGEVIYWNYGDKMPARSRKMAEIMATSSGYALDTPIGIATGGGFKDWFITEFNRPAFTVELGLGKNPLPPEKAKEIYNKVEEMLMLCTVM